VASADASGPIICPPKERKDDELWHNSSPAFALARRPPLLKRKKTWANVKMKICFDDTSHRICQPNIIVRNKGQGKEGRDDNLWPNGLTNEERNKEDCGNRGGRRQEAMEREGTKKKKKKGTHFSLKRPYPL
jgi:hypothetical protein